MAKILVGVRIDGGIVKYWKGVAELKDQSLAEFLIAAVDDYAGRMKDREKVDLLRQAYGLPKMKR